MIDEPQRSACRPVGTLDDTSYVWTLADGRGLEHPHGPDGCPFDVGGPWYEQAELLAGGLAGEPCAGCGQVHG